MSLDKRIEIEFLGSSITTTMAAIMIRRYNSENPVQIPQFLFARFSPCSPRILGLRCQSQLPPRQSVNQDGGRNKTSVHQNSAGYRTIMPTVINIGDVIWAALGAAESVAVGGDGANVLTSP
jgi:hypothetical protein